MIRPAQVPSTGRAAAHELAQRLGEPFALDAERHRGGLAARDHEAVEPLEVRRRAHHARLGPELRERAACASKSPWMARTPTTGPATGLPAAVLQQAAVGLERADLDAGHGLAQLARGGGHALRVVVVGGGLDDRARAALGVGRLEDARARRSCPRRRAASSARRRPGWRCRRRRTAPPAGGPSRPRRAPARAAPAAPWPRWAAPSRSSDAEAPDLAGDQRGCGAPPRPRCRCRPRPSSGSSPRPRRCGAAPRPGWWRRTRTAP